ncbi:MAG TPA: DMT family transporter [Steroidobacteraceae bacterium]|nr:DMT family transporter [Steroidobacteraceae bacterium]HQZ79796.1 DMT family transporter [Steroidobacteraceae bacterium]
MRTRDLSDMLLLGAIWGGAFVLMRIASPVFGATALAGVRIAVALLVLVLFLRHWQALREQPLALLALGAINTAVPFSLFAYAMLSITSGLAALLNATTPMFGALIAWAWLGERLTIWRVTGIVIAFGGVAWLVHGAIGTLGAGAVPGVVAALAAAALYGIGASFTRRYLGAADPAAVAAGSVLGAMLVIAPFSIATWPQAPISLQGWLAAGALGVFCTGVAYLIYFRLMRSVGAGRAVAVAFLFPVFGILWGAVVLHEPVTSSLLAGCAVVLVGTALSVGLADRVTFAR